MGQIVPKRWHIKFRHRGITQNTAYNTSYLTIMYILRPSVFNFKTPKYSCRANQSIPSSNYSVAHYSVLEIISINFTVTSYTLFVRRCLSSFTSFCEPIFLPNDGWSRQPKHAAKLGKNQYTKFVYLCCSQSKLNAWNWSRSVAAYRFNRRTWDYYRWLGG